MSIRGKRRSKSSRLHRQVVGLVVSYLGKVFSSLGFTPRARKWKMEAPKVFQTDNLTDFWWRTWGDMNQKRKLHRCSFIRYEPRVVNVPNVWCMKYWSSKDLIWIESQSRFVHAEWLNIDTLIVEMEIPCGHSFQVLNGSDSIASDPFNRSLPMLH